MTEAEWLACTDPDKMLKFLQGRASDRKLRLFSCACCRRVWHLLKDGTSRHAVEVAERFADGLVRKKDLNLARSKARATRDATGHWEGPDYLAWCAIRPNVSAAARSAAGTSVWWAACELTTFGSSPAWKVGDLMGERARQVGVLRDIVGNPFHPLTPRAFPPSVQGLAQAINEGDHSLYPLLADALDDLGEPDAAGHCRQGEHVKGCHIVDWVLGME